MGRHPVSKGLCTREFGLGSKLPIEVLKDKWLVALCAISAFGDAQLCLSVSGVK